MKTRGSSFAAGLIPAVVAMVTIIALVPTPQLAETAAPVTPARGGTLRFGVKGDTTGFDLQKISLTSGKVMFDLLYAGLVEFDVKLNVVPRLARSWEVSADGLTYIFHLRPALKFSDGKDLTAKDVEFTFKRLLNPSTGSPWRSLFAAISTIQARDPTTVVFRLSRPSIALLGHFAHTGAGIIPQDYVEGGGDINLRPVGAGAFRLRDWNPGVHVLMWPNPHYYERGVPYLGAVRFSVETDDNARAAAIRAGEMDFLQRAPVEGFGNVFERDPNLRIIGGEIGEFRELMLNTKRKPLDDKRVRQAIAWAIDRKALLEVAVGRYGVALNGGVIPPPHWAYLEDACYRQDYTRARQLLAEAGYANGFKMDVVVPSGFGILIRPAEAIKEQLRPLGIDIEIKAVEVSVWLDKRNKGDFDSFMTGWSGLVDPEQFMAFWESDSQVNYSGFRNPQFDALAVRGRRAREAKERGDIYREAQKLLCNESPSIVYGAYFAPDVVRTSIDISRFHFMYDWSYKMVRYIWLRRP